MSAVVLSWMWLVVDRDKTWEESKVKKVFAQLYYWRNSQLLLRITVVVNATACLLVGAVNAPIAVDARALI